MDERNRFSRAPSYCGDDTHPLPETLAEAELLVASIERAVHEETGRAVRDLSVKVSEEGVLLRGRCSSYYTKQLAQHAAMATPGGDAVTNEIEVCS
ncbi:MAG: BON domain-containing protein [Patescibacteria group bacterium]|nr:BON domain-containing protein [Patescibacteria group bacterium]